MPVVSTEGMVSVSPSPSVSLPSTVIVAAVSLSVTALSATATGASLTPVIVTVTVADDETLEPWRAMYVNVSVAVSPTFSDRNWPLGL